MRHHLSGGGCPALHAEPLRDPDPGNGGRASDRDAPLIYLAILIVLCCLALVVSCGGGGGGGGSGPGTGTLDVRATDAPFAHGLVAEATVTGTRISVHADAGASSGFLTLFQADPGASPPVPPRVVDLADLVNGATQPLALTQVPAGSYRQVRLRVSDAFLRLTNGREYSTSPQGGQLPLQLTSQDTSGFKVFIDPPVAVGGGLVTTLLLDFDLTKTFLPNPASDAENATGYQLQPVIRATVFPTELNGTVLFAGTTAPVDGATVSVLEAGTTTVVATTATNADGRYAILGLAPATYDVKARLVCATGDVVESPRATVVVPASGAVTQDLGLPPCP